MDVGVIAHGPRKHPPEIDISEVEGSGKLTLERRAAARDRVAFEEPGLRLHLITGLADLDRGPQQHRRLRRSNTPDLVGGLRRLQVPVDRRRRHRQQLPAHRGTVTVDAIN